MNRTHLWIQMDPLGPDNQSNLYHLCNQAVPEYHRALAVHMGLFAQQAPLVQAGRVCLEDLRVRVVPVCNNDVREDLLEL